jgi:arylsulfatase A-like enzyme
VAWIDRCALRRDGANVARVTASEGWAKRVSRALVGDRPWMIVCFLAPTLLAIALDVCIRARSFTWFNGLDRLNYFGSSLASAGFWGGPLWLISRLFLVREGRRKVIAARVGLALFFGAWVLPFAVFCYGGQALYHAVFHSYMARDTVRLGIALRGTMKDWLASWGGSRVFFVMLLPGIVVTVGTAFLTRKAAPAFARSMPVLPAVGFVGALCCFWVDFVESRSLQAAPPDTCFIHGVVHAVHDGVTGKGWVKRGVSLRTPAPLPPLPIVAHRPNVLVILTESVRSDAMCSEPPPVCQAPFFDAVASNRIGLGKLTTQSSGTFTACMMLWTGLGPNVDFKTAHEAPLLWEIAKAVGYRTAYVTSQNLRYDDFGAYTKVAGIDYRVEAMDLGDTIDAQVGAPDERAADRMLEFARGVHEGTPWFGVLHYSNTHSPYRIDPSLVPFQPASTDPLGDPIAFRNHYLNSVRFQERTTTELLRALETLPSWNDTVVIFLSDHGEQFREHGGLYHLSSLFDEQLRIPGFLVAGPDALAQPQLDALATWSGARTYTRDVTATVLDLFGVLDVRSTLPFSDLTQGRSLLRRRGMIEPLVPLSTASGVWEPNDPQYGLMRGDALLIGSPVSTWVCYDTKRDPQEFFPRPALDCGSTMIDGANHAFPGIVPPK